MSPDFISPDFVPPAFMSPDFMSPFVVLFGVPDVPVVPLLVFVPLALGCGVPIWGVLVLPPPEPPEPPEPPLPPLCASAVPASITPAKVNAIALFHVFIGVLLGDAGDMTLAKTSAVACAATHMPQLCHAQAQLAWRLSATAFRIS
jgi:hypothetical protein